MAKNFLKVNLAKIVAKIIRWKIVADADVPDKCVVVGAPHTCNLDGVLMILLSWISGYEVKFLVKDSLFKFPFGWFIRKLGGIAVNRRHPNGMVGMLKEEFENRNELRLVITPEGTRSYTDCWKSGFYHIALGAGVPVTLGYIDYATRTAGFAHSVFITGNVKEDMDIMRDFYKDKRGIHPELFGPVRLRSEVASEK